MRGILPGILALTVGVASSASAAELVFRPPALVATDDSYREFGRGIALAGETVVVGERKIGEAGRVWTAVRSGDQWQQVQLVPDTPVAPGHDYGLAVAGDPQGRVLVAAPPPGGANGVVFSFKADAGIWLSLPTLVPSSAINPGSALAIHGDAAFIGDESLLNEQLDKAGGLHIFLWQDDHWSQAGLPVQPPMLSSGAGFGASLAIHESGEFAVIGAPYEANGAGAVYRVSLDVNLDDWERLQPPNLMPGEDFGRSVALSGDSILVGAPLHGLNGAVFELGVNDEWTEIPLSADASGALIGSSLWAEAGRALVGAPGLTGDGGVYLLTATGDGWQTEQTIKAPEPQSGALFGARVLLAGDRALVSEPKPDGLGAVYEFTVRKSTGETCLNDLECASKICFESSCCVLDCEPAAGSTGPDGTSGGTDGTSAASTGGEPPTTSSDPTDPSDGLTTTGRPSPGLGELPDLVVGCECRSSDAGAPPWLWCSLLLLVRGRRRSRLTTR